MCIKANNILSNILFKADELSFSPSRCLGGQNPYNKNLYPERKAEKNRRFHVDEDQEILPLSKIISVSSSCLKSLMYLVE